MIKRIAAFIASSRGLVALGAIIAALLGLSFALWERGNAWQSTADKWRLNSAAQKASYIAAQRAATADALAAKVNTERRIADISRKADNDTRTDTRIAIASRFADSRRVRSEAVGCAPGKATPATSDHAAADRDGPGRDAVLLTRAEYDEFVQNTLRLDHVRQWGEALIESGLAVRQDARSAPAGGL